MASACNCLDGITKKIVEDQPFEGLKVTRATVKETVILFNSFGTRTMSHVELTCESRKRPVSHTLIHTFCPFCGQKYESDKEVSNG